MQASVTQTGCDAVHLLLLLAAVVLQWRTGTCCGAGGPPWMQLLMVPAICRQLLWMPRLHVRLMDGQTVIWLLGLHRQAAGVQQLTKLLNGVVSLGSLAATQSLSHPAQTPGRRRVKSLDCAHGSARCCMADWLLPLTLRAQGGSNCTTGRTGSSLVYSRHRSLLTAQMLQCHEDRLQTMHPRARCISFMPAGRRFAGGF